MGIQADLLLCRSDRPISLESKRKLAQFCNLPQENVIAAVDAKNIYQVPLHYHEEGLDERVCNYFKLKSSQANLDHWLDVHKKVRIFDSDY